MIVWLTDLYEPIHPKMILQNFYHCIRFLCSMLLITSAVHLDAAQQTASAAAASTGFVEVEGGKLYYEEGGQFGDRSCSPQAIGFTNGQSSGHDA
jgi:hypothetical protein